MARGQNKIEILGQHLIGQKHGLWDFIYTTSTTKDLNHNIGDVEICANRGIFVYSKSSAACISGQGCEFTYTGYISITTMVVPAAVGDRSITVPAAAHAVLGLDELRNGFLWIFDGTTNNTQFRQILGNDAAADGAAFVVYLDGPLTEAVTTSSKVEVCQNPYAALRTGTSDSLAKAGVPAVKVTAADTYFWCQVGRIPSYCWVAPQGGVNDRDIGCWWRHDGSLQDTELAIMAGTSLSAGISSQYAGHRIMGCEDYIGPLFLLV